MKKAEPIDKWAERRRLIASKQQRAYIERIKAGVGDLAPEGAMENDARVYTDPVRFEKEMETLFRDYPILAGLSHDLPEPGSIILFEELGQSIIITRTQKDEVKAYLNMCPHRAMTLIDKPCKKKLISCPFHGWSFDLEGNLVGMLEPEGFENINRDDRGLIDVPVVEWCGLIFILPRAGQDKIDIVSHLGEFAVELEQLEFHRSLPIKSGCLDAACNWKYALDTYGEAYHFPVLHKENVALFNSTESLYERFGPHSRIGWPTRDLAEFVDRPEEDWPDSTYGGVHYLFPNTIIFYGSVGAGESFVQIFRHFPKDVDNIKTHFKVYSRAEIATEDYRKFVETAGFDGTLHIVETEDYWVAEQGYAKLKAAPEGFTVLYGANEWSLQDKHIAIAEACGMPLEVYENEP